MSTEDPATQTEDPAAVERALRVGLEDFELSDADRCGAAELSGFAPRSCARIMSASDPRLNGSSPLSIS